MNMTMLKYNVACIVMFMLPLPPSLTVEGGMPGRRGGARGPRRPRCTSASSCSTDLSGRGVASAEDAQGTPKQSHLSSNILAYEDSTYITRYTSIRRLNEAGERPRRWTWHARGRTWRSLRASRSLTKLGTVRIVLQSN